MIAGMVTNLTPGSDNPSERCRKWPLGSSPLAPLTLADLPGGAAAALTITEVQRAWCGGGEEAGGGGGGGSSGGGGMVCKVIFGSGGSGNASGGGASSSSLAAAAATAGAAAKWVAEDVLHAAPAQVLRRYFLSADHARLMRGAVGGDRVTANPNIYPTVSLYKLNSVYP
jgi:hypothetical protein